MRGTRVAIALVFLADGLLLGSWAARIPAVQRQADLTTTQPIPEEALSLGSVQTKLTGPQHGVMLTEGNCVSPPSLPSPARGEGT